MGRHDVTITVFDIDEEKVTVIRNAVLSKIDGTTDFSISSDERTEVNAAGAGS